MAKQHLPKPPEKKDPLSQNLDTPLNAEASPERSVVDLEREIANLNARITEGREQNARLQERATVGDLLRHAIHTEVRAGETHDQAVARVLKERDELREQVRVDGPAFNQGRAEGKSDVAAELRRILDPEDKEHLNLDGLLKLIGQLVADAAARPVPAEGWASERAKVLVLGVPPGDRDFLLGDLLTRLVEFTGERGDNEGAVEVLTRKMKELALATETLTRRDTRLSELTDALNRRDAQIEKLQGAMVARRAPDDGLASEHARVLAVMDGAIPLRYPVRGAPSEVLKTVLQEWAALRTFFSAHPLVALAVKDESTREVEDRFTLLLLEWDGKTLSPTVVEERMPWGDLQARMRHLVDTRLVPAHFRE